MKLAESILEDLWFAEDDREAADGSASESLAAKLADGQGLKPFPIVVQRVLTILGDPGYAVSDVTKTIREDTSLAAKVLRVANSPLFGGRARCISINDAITRLGARTVVELVTSISLAGMFEDVGGRGKSIRDHCAATAAIARLLAIELRPRFSDGIFLAGLMHDVGKLMLIQSGEVDYAKLEPFVTCEADQVHLLEREHLGYDHAVLGSHVLNLWKMPEKVQRVVAWHHQPGRAYGEGGEIGTMVGMLRLADQIDSIMRAPATSPKTIERFIEKLADGVDGAYARATTKALTDIWDLLFHARADSLALFR